MHLFHILLLISFVFLASSYEISDPKNVILYNDWKTASSVYDFTVQSFNGTYIPMTKYKENVLVIVNIPNDCLCSSRDFSELNELSHTYYDVGLRILAFPCNQFNIVMAHYMAYKTELVFVTCRNQTKNLKISCSTVKNAKFELMAQVDVNGRNTIPLYNYLKLKQPGFLFSAIKWSYTKFLINRNGKVVERYSPDQFPLEMVNSIKYYLNLMPSNRTW